MIVFFILIVLVISIGCNQDNECQYKIRDYMAKYESIGHLQKLKNGLYLIDERHNEEEGGVYIFNKDSILHEYLYFNSSKEIVYDEQYKDGKLINIKGSPMILWDSYEDSSKQHLNIFLSTINKDIDSPTLYFKGKYYNLTLKDIESPLQSNIKYISIYLNDINVSDIKENEIIFNAKYIYCNGVIKYISDTL
jgi:hypothetical protein